jgi:hypothetical protein
MNRFVALSAVALTLVTGNAASAGGWPFHSHCCETCCIVPKCRPSADQFVNGELLTGIPCFPYACGWCREPYVNVAPSFPPAGMYQTGAPAGYPATVVPAATPTPANAPVEPPKADLQTAPAK